MRIVVAIYSPSHSWCIPDAQMDRLRRESPAHSVTKAESDAETLAAIADADIAFSSRINPSHLAAAQKLRWIHSPAAGVGAMLFPEMIANDIVMTNSRGNSAVTIAEHTIAVTLALLRQLPLAWRRQQTRTWAQNEFSAGGRIRTLRGARVLVVGLGAIGTAAASLAVAFGATVIGLRKHPARGGVAGVTVFGPDALPDELPQADVVIVAAPLTLGTVHLLGEGELRSMKRDAVLVNVSRGKLIDEAALSRVLDAGHLRGAALDVFEHEPLPPESPLWDRADVIVTPHVSGFHAKYWQDATTMFLDNLRRFEHGEALVNVVDKQAGY